jgi:hypothetical protein
VRSWRRKQVSSLFFFLARETLFSIRPSLYFSSPPRKRVKGATRDAEKKRRIKGADGDDG